MSEATIFSLITVGVCFAASALCGFLVGLWLSPSVEKGKKKGDITVEIKGGGYNFHAPTNSIPESDLDFFHTSIGAYAPAGHIQKKCKVSCEHIHEEKKQILKVKRLSEQSIKPERATLGSAGYDLTAVSRSYLPTEGRYIYGTGLAFEIPAGFCGLLFPRSSVSARLLRPSHAVGVIDADYRGEVKVCLDERQGVAGLAPYAVGDRVAQLVLVPCGTFDVEEVENLSETERGKGGFGSTGV